MKYIWVPFIFSLVLWSSLKSTFDVYIKLLGIYCYSDKFDFCSTLLLYTLLCQHFSLNLSIMWIFLYLYLPFDIRKGWGVLQRLTPFPSTLLAHVYNRRLTRMLTARMLLFPVLRSPAKDFVGIIFLILCIIKHCHVSATWLINFKWCLSTLNHYGRGRAFLSLLPNFILPWGQSICIRFYPVLHRCWPSAKSIHCAEAILLEKCGRSPFIYQRRLISVH